MRRVLSTIFLSLTTAQLGCLSMLVPPHGQGDAPAQVHAPIVPHDTFVTLKAPADAHAELCTADNQHPNFPDDADLLTKTFCQDLKPGGVIPTPHGLHDLLAQLGIDFKDPNGANGQNGNPGFALLAHSSALTARKVSSITPTAFVFTPPPADGSTPHHYAFVAFDPGEEFVEVAVDDATVNTVNFYLVRFDKDCNNTPAGCSNGDLLSQSLITGWSNVRVYEDTTAVNNTIVDCHVCHTPNTAQQPFLRMQEIEPPFTHWMSMLTEGGRALFADFRQAHSPDEDYGPIPAAMVEKSDPALMAQMIKQAGFGTQPNAFPSAEIEAQLKAAAPQQPTVNVPIGSSQSWQDIYLNAVGGSFIATPYHDVKVTDPTKLATMSAAWKAWKAGSRPDLPDLRDVFLDLGLRDMGFAPRAGLDGKSLLVQMCQQCHNANLDLTLSREKFLVDQLGKMSRDEKQLAITRLKLGDDDRLRMPPVLFRTVTDDETNAMIQALSQ
jgi:hypothetical protein